jgi:hypothetical protein
MISTQPSSSPQVSGLSPHPSPNPHPSSSLQPSPDPQVSGLSPPTTSSSALIAYQTGTDPGRIRIQNIPWGLTKIEGVGGCICLIYPENQKQKVKVL